LEDDELRVLRLLDMPITKSDLSEATGLEDERLRTILQLLKRTDLAQLIEGKRWQLTELGTKKLEEAEEEPEEEYEPPQKVSLTTQFKIHKKQRELLNRCEELSTLDLDWDKLLLKDFELIKDNVSFIKQKLNEASSQEELEELEALLEDLDKTWEELFIRNEQLSDKNRKFELDTKLLRIREFYTEFYPGLTQEELEKMIKRCREDPEQLKNACQHMESNDNLEYLLEHTFEHEIDPRFVRNIHYLADTEKLELEYVVQLWKDYNLLASRYGPQEAHYFIKDRGPPILKKRGNLWETFHRYMFPQRTPTPGY